MLPRNVDCAEIDASAITGDLPVASHLIQGSILTGRSASLQPCATFGNPFDVGCQRRERQRRTGEQWRDAGADYGVLRQSMTGRWG